MSQKNHSPCCKPLIQFFLQVNAKYFDNFLDLPELKWNSRLRTSAGRFIPGRRFMGKTQPACIEIAQYLLQQQEADALILDTLSHEMIHYWLWVRKRPYGHTSEFYVKMKLMGVSRYNPVPQTKPYSYRYACPFCQKIFLSHRPCHKRACLKCCREFSKGQFDIRFQLIEIPSSDETKALK